MPSSASSTASSLDECYRNIRPNDDLPTLILISHAHSPPLNPPPKLKFDCRSLPNPPKHVRDQYNGTSKRLQEWMETHGEFGERRDVIRRVILEEMGKAAERGEEKPPALNERRNDGEIGAADQEEENRKDLTSDNREAEFDNCSGSDDVPELRVGIFCEMGRHRSVAMVELLSKISWPGWTVEVVHRDMSKKRRQKTGRRDKNGRGNRGGSSSFADESE